MQKLYGLIGFPLEHSFSKGYFTEKFKSNNLSNCRYENFPIKSIGELNNIIEANPDLIGLNVTIPYKISIIDHLDELDGNAKSIQSVNTIKIVRENKIKLIGYNTDIIGLTMALKPQLRPAHNRALILGNGGSSKAVQFVLKSLGIGFLIVSRNPKLENEISYAELNENHIRFHQLIINTTPLGMWPNVEEFPEINYDFISSEHLLFDLIYNPEMTIFLKKGKEKGAMISNGLSMLHQQAEASWQIWNK
jgi:shikimate dehydrogenase